MMTNSAGVVFKETPEGIDIDLIGMDTFDPNNPTQAQAVLVSVLMWLRQQQRHVSPADLGCGDTDAMTLHAVRHDISLAHYLEDSQ